MRVLASAEEPLAGKDVLHALVIGPAVLYTDRALTSTITVVLFGMGLFDKLFNKQPKPGTPMPVGDDDFEAEVLSWDTPVVVQFYSNTCPHCHVMGGLLKELGPEFNGQIKFTTMNVNYSPVTAKGYQIRSVPTVLIFRNGRPKDSIVGLMPLHELKARLRRFLPKE